MVKPTPSAGPPEIPPQPTYAPAALAMGVLFTLWGVTTHWFMSAAGIGLIAWSLISWVNDIRRHWRAS